MHFEVSKGSGFFWGNPAPWLVERVLIPGERYLIAVYDTKDEAAECLEVIKKSVEAKRGAPCVIAP